jgi:hypothetical protein
MVDFSGSPLAWGVLIGFGLSNDYSFWFVSKQVWRRLNDPEWRKSSDAWSWPGVALAGTGVLAMIAISLGFVILNAVWYLTH